MRHNVNAKETVQGMIGEWRDGTRDMKYEGELYNRDDKSKGNGRGDENGT